ncbi:MULTISPECIES: glycosyltransferase [unclassified Fibrobacter]|uniref:glycosyltransferase n=1 Tax=unclassified Fibrobacter TaxID=2634177 RepID=UPI000D6B4D22|nr:MULTISPECIES: glycosyltransferase [unclassified Fibrobacter]PWJ63064.1 glycosyl transferase family 8 [Fibrobacter sp. UWR4]PZW68235.1 glycosyl transferase family 8 [Fibrobacter sp. UWR1]
MKIAYVLVSDNHDFYLEQAHVSLLSLKERMPNAYVSLVVDNRTACNLTEKRGEILNLANEYKIVDLPDDMNAMIRSRQLKTTLRDILEGDILYVDVDTIWNGSIDESLFCYDVMGVPDSHLPYKCLLKSSFDNSMKKLGFNREFDYFINGGVLFMKDTPKSHEFSKRWNSLWKECCSHGIFTDQQSLNQTNFEFDGLVKHLPHTYNAQISFSIKYFAEAVLIHYFACAQSFGPETNLLKKEEFWKSVKAGLAQEQIQAVVASPQNSWDVETVAMSSSYQREYLGSPIVGLILTMANSPKKMPRVLFSWLNKCVKIFVSVYNGMARH